MHTRFLIFLMCLSRIIAAQQEQSHWLMGTYLGIRFNNGTAQVIPVNTSKMYAPFGSSSWSDPATGELLFYTSGAYVYNRQHKQMPNGFYINDETMSPHCVVVPMPGQKHKYYIFSSGTYSHKLYYTIVDMSMQGGLGDVASKGHVLAVNADNALLACSQLYNQGFWLITHQWGTNNFITYRITENGIETQTIVSQTGGISGSSTNYTTGKMVLNSNGDRLVYTYQDALQTGVTEEFEFDRRCGTLSQKIRLFAHPLQAQEIIAYPEWSPNGRFLYINWMYNSGQVMLLQYDMQDTDPNSSYVIIDQNDSRSGDLKLGGDGKIYQATAYMSTVSTLLNVMHKPDLQGKACDLRIQTFDLCPPIVPPFGTYFTEHFPEFVYIKWPKSTDSIPRLRIEHQCLGEPTQLSAYIPVEADSFYWELGDGNTSKSVSPVHTYASEGKYPIRLVWYICSFAYSASDTVRIGAKPVFSLGPDTTICPGTSTLLRGPASGDQYWWNTGDTTRDLVASEKKQYTLKVRKGACFGESSVQVDVYPPLWTELGDEYTICDEEHELVKLDAGEGFVKYKWTPTQDTTQWIVVGDLGSYFVVVNDFRGCRGEDGTKVTRRCPVELYFPNAFTPNRDGLNDVYQPVGTDIVTFEIFIYNRWGDEVFHSKNIDQNWDGTVKQNDAPDGVYHFVATYSGYRNKRLTFFESSGNISLIR